MKQIIAMMKKATIEIMMKKMMTMLMMKAYNVRRFIQQQMYEVVQKLYIVADHEKDEKKISVMHII